MDKRSVLFIILSMAIILLWYSVFTPEPQQEPVAPEPVVTTPEPRVGDTREIDPVPTTEEGDATEDDRITGEAIGADVAERIEFENDIYRVTFTNRGARVLSWRLNDYGMNGDESLELLPCASGEDPPLSLALSLEDEYLARDANAALYQVEREPVYADGGLPPGERIRFKWADGRGLEVEKTLTFREGDYLVEIDVRVIDRGRPVPARVVWGPGFGEQGSRSRSLVDRYYRDGGQDVRNVGGIIGRKDVDEDGLAVSGRVVWAGLEDGYFAALVVPRSSAGDIRGWEQTVVPCPDPEGEGETEPRELIAMAVSIPPDGALMFVGPKAYQLLSSLGYELERSVWFSDYWLFAVIAKWLLLALLWIQENVVSNYGLAIILATVALRIVLFPLNQFSMVRMRKSQMEMQRLQPKINAIKKKYSKKKDGESRARMNQEMMELYKKEGVSPMGGMVGCLPLLAQFPILIGFYNMLTVAIELRGAPFFGWIQDLSQKDPLYITPILMGVSMLVQQKISQSKVTDPTQLQQQRIMMFMPIMFTVLFLNLPSGMVLYWFVSNLLGIGQQWLVNRHTNRTVSASKKVKA
jgi:YidC/Oxa1 family membrane protein insertase